MSDARLLSEIVELRAVWTLGPDGRLVEGPDRDPGHPVWDLERLCRVVLDGHLRATATKLEARDYVEALSCLLGEAFVVAPRYDPTRGQVNFAAWMQGQLRFVLQDHLRSPYAAKPGQRDLPGRGRLGHARLAELDRGGLEEGRDTVERALAREQADRGDDRDLVVEWVYAARDRGPLRPLAGVGS